MVVVVANKHSKISSHTTAVDRWTFPTVILQLRLKNLLTWSTETVPFLWASSRWNSYNIQHKTSLHTYSLDSLARVYSYGDISQYYIHQTNCCSHVKNFATCTFSLNKFLCTHVLQRLMYMPFPTCCEELTAELSNKSSSKWKGEVLSTLVHNNEERIAWESLPCSCSSYNATLTEVWLKQDALQ